MASPSKLYNKREQPLLDSRRHRRWWCALWSSWRRRRCSCWWPCRRRRTRQRRSHWRCSRAPRLSTACWAAPGGRSCRAAWWAHDRRARPACTPDGRCVCRTRLARWDWRRSSRRRCWTSVRFCCCSGATSWCGSSPPWRSTWGRAWSRLDSWCSRASDSRPPVDPWAETRPARSSSCCETIWREMKV